MAVSYTKDCTFRIIRTRHIVDFTEGVSRARDIQEDLARVPKNAKLIEVVGTDSIPNLRLVFEDEQEAGRE